jgi:hypothetical protein
MGSSHDQHPSPHGWFPAVQCGGSGCRGPLWKDRFSPKMTLSLQVCPFSGGLYLYCEVVVVDQRFQPQKLGSFGISGPEHDPNSSSRSQRRRSARFGLPVQHLDYSRHSVRPDSLPTPHSPHGMNDNPTRRAVTTRTPKVPTDLVARNS